MVFISSAGLVVRGRIRWNWGLMLCSPRGSISPRFYPALYRTPRILHTACMLLWWGNTHIQYTVLGSLLGKLIVDSIYGKTIYLDARLIGVNFIISNIWFFRSGRYGSPERQAGICFVIHSWKSLFFFVFLPGWFFFF